MADIHVEAFLAALSDSAPCGQDLTYDEAFILLEDAARGKPEQQYGSTVFPAQDPDWRTMEAQATSLFERTRDLRIALYLLRAKTKLIGFDGFALGVELIEGLLARHWEHVHPQLDASDNNDPTMRLNALAPLASHGQAIADLRNVVIGHPRDGLSVHQIELGLRVATPIEGEIVPTEAGVNEALTVAIRQMPGLLERIIAVDRCMKSIQAIISRHVAAADGPDLQPLGAITQLLANAARAVAGVPAAVIASGNITQPGADHPAASISGLSAKGQIDSRDTAIRMLEHVCEWIDRNEPTNPAPLLIRRAQRLMTQSFIDIVRELAPDGLKDVQRIAGVNIE